MVSIDQLLGWQPDRLGAVADDLVRRRKLLVDLQDELDGAGPPSSWISRAADTARQKHEQLRLRLLDMAAEVSDVIVNLDDAESRATDAKRLLEDALGAARGHGFTVDHATGVVRDPAVYDDAGERDLAAGRVQAVADDISAALTRAADADQDLAAALRSAAAGEVDGGTGSLADAVAQLPTRVDEMTVGEQVAWVEANLPGLDPVVAGALRPEVQRHFAGEVATDTQNPQDIDTDTVRLLELFADEEAFAHELYSTVTPAEMAAAVRHLSSTAYPAITPSAVDEDADAELYRDFLSAAGHTLATHSKAAGAYAPPADLVDRWHAAITADGRHGQGAALTLLIRAGGQETSYDGAFLADLTHRVLDWERGQEGAVWGPRDDPMHQLVNPFLTDENGSRSGTDGLANLLGAMENSPDAAQRFFMDGDGAVDEGKLEYLVTERTFSFLSASDEGEGLGAALRAAAVGDRDHELVPGTSRYRDEWSATFTSDLFTLIADKSGTGDGFGPDDTWHVWPDMTDDLGTIAAGYSGDVYDIVDGAPQSGPTHLAVSGDDLDKVLGEIGRGDKTGIETLSAAVMIEGNERINDAIEQWQAEHPGRPMTMEALADSGLAVALQGRGATNGEVLGHVLNESVLVDLEDEELARTRAAYVSKALDIAGGFIPGAGSVLGEGASEVAKSAYDNATGEGLDLLKGAVEGSPEATASQYVDQSRDTTERALEYNVLNQLIRNGYLAPGDGQTGIPESLLVEGPDGTRVINPDLYDEDGVDKIGEDGDYTDAEIDRMREDWSSWMNSQERNYAEGITQQAQDGFDRAVNKGS